MPHSSEPPRSIPGEGVFRPTGDECVRDASAAFIQQVQAEYANAPMSDTIRVQAGHGIFDQGVPRDSVHARTRLVAPRGRQANDPREVWINHGAGGIGDALLGLCAVKGYKAAHPDRIIIYRIHETASHYCTLFTGADHFGLHVWDRVKHEFPLGDDGSECDARDLQINLGYRQELRSHAQLTRLERYCRNLGYVTPIMPVLREPELIRKEAQHYTNRIVLCPFSSQVDRNYPLRGWLTIEHHLLRAGHECVVIGTKHSPRVHGMEMPNRTDLFQSQVVTDPSPKMLTGIILASKLLIGNDSAPIHIAGLLGKQAIALCGWSVGDKIFSFYPSVRSLQGVLGCNGCWTESPAFDGIRCTISCDNLASIDPQTVLREVLTRVRVPAESEK